MSGWRNLARKNIELESTSFVLRRLPTFPVSVGDVVGAVRHRLDRSTHFDLSLRNVEHVEQGEY